ncbi:MAG: helix-turn-helix transcriptional regulator [Solirubrobacteraceae bacterium]|nr:MAG: WYL domain-containing protein [Solirubrobacterales bacterium]
MAKDTEKLIRQLSLISYLMAERRPVTALDIRSDVEGYSAMNEDAFARRFYADRAELESLGIELTVERPVEGAAEQETYSLAPERFHLPLINFSDNELAALQTALQLLDGRFAYAEPLRLALQQIAWGRPSPLTAPEQRTVRLGLSPEAGGHDVSQRLQKIEAAIFRRKTIVFEYYSLARDELSTRRVDPYQLVYQGGQFYLVGHSHEREATRVFRLSRIRGKVSYSSKAEHDFQRPTDFDPRDYADRIEWQLGETAGEAEIWIGERIVWQVERHFARYGALHEAESGAGDRIFLTPYSDARQLVSWVLGLGEHARILGPAQLSEEMHKRLELLARRHRSDELPAAAAAAAAGSAPPSNGAAPRAPDDGDDADLSDRREAAIRPERFARLVTLATMLIGAARAGHPLTADELRAKLQVSDSELREDIEVLNIVNFGAGSYVLYVELRDSGEIEIDLQPYSDHFDRPARLLPIEAKALVAAIDLLGDHLPAGVLSSARQKIVSALGEDPAEAGLQVASSAGDDSGVARDVSRAVAERRVIELDYYKENEDELSERRVQPYALTNGREGWYIVAFDPDRDALRHFRLDRVKRVAVTDERFERRAELDVVDETTDAWLRTGEVEASRTARLWVSPERARWEREERRVLEELDDGAIVVERSYAGVDWLVREVLKEAGDAAVLEPEDARTAVAEAVARLMVTGEAAGSSAR